MILIENYKYTIRATFSRIYFNGKLVCYLIQDTLRPFGIKVYGETGIPAGKGTLKLGHSNRFGLVPFLYNQPDEITYKQSGISFTHLRIHAGNFINETDGCPMTGTSVNYVQERTFSSRKALKKLMSHLEMGVEYPFEIKNLRQKK